MLAQLPDPPTLEVAEFQRALDERTVVIEYWLGARRYRSPLYTPPASSKPSDDAGLPAAHTVATSGFTSLGCYNVFSSFPTW